MYWIKVSERLGINLEQVIFWHDGPDIALLTLYTTENMRTIELRGQERARALALLERVAEPNSHA